MFSKKLASSVLNICDSRKLSYETASELCGIGPRYFGSIVRSKTSPTINTLEKLCIGLDRTPNELLGFSTASEELSFRFPMQVTHFCKDFSPSCSCPVIPICPRCHGNLGCEYQAFCAHCGQKLSWDCFGYAMLMAKK